ncbi:MAG: co-chaperone GroES [Candidatus Magasanikbacteria bacterium]|uniref:Co-chaperonin GroES n=1 Tax=Candidatus Magasanikbacteria bacterium CG10_big_fil_rev_8_21_14_0_10_38_6 TaxID=1974647 RepID=A0A2M6P262_9BACT|nr:co-chaperone GroES [Candidatus Magasanikbacteria bacterium]NCS71929.1 co-chaperone GroES [Candidatus Magasanikbacteria bacterium]PIR77815.1 MAG: co-chaperone GroES [Candidatus Magasanikbacteria bacterium CG10_big_fil_rev_8_21_14_0_10_38_6]
MNITPLGDRVVVKQLTKEEVTASGILLPETVDKEKKSEAEVVAIGPGKMLESGILAPMHVLVGQIVLIRSWGGDDVEIDGQEYKIVSEEDILAIMEK